MEFENIRPLSEKFVTGPQASKYATVLGNNKASRLNEAKLKIREAAAFHRARYDSATR